MLRPVQFEDETKPSMRLLRPTHANLAVGNLADVDLDGRWVPVTIVAGALQAVSTVWVRRLTTPPA